jgi:hypothetical protein
VELCYWPCTHEKAAVAAIGGHASHVTKCRFTCDDQYLITTGGFSRCVVQYKLIPTGADSNGIGVTVTADADLPPLPSGQPEVAEPEEKE